MTDRFKQTLMNSIAGALLCAMCVTAQAGLQQGLDAYRDGNYKVALKELTPLAAKGDAQALFTLGAMNEAGQGVPKNQKKAQERYLAAAKAGHAEAQYKTAQMQRDEQEALSWYRKAAEQGHLEAQLVIAHSYAAGKGVAKDDQEAAVWYRKAAEQGSVEAQFRMGVMSAGGQGVPRDEVEAVSWLTKAAEQGHLEAQFNLGQIYREARNPDYTKSLLWYWKAADAGYAPAQYNLGLMYRQGVGVAQNYKTALYLLRHAATQSQAAALLTLGEMYAGGEGVNKDMVQAYKWYKLASLSGLAEADAKLKEAEKSLDPKQIKEADIQALQWRSQHK